jgi:hypothetical protein
MPPPASAIFTSGVRRQTLTTAVIDSSAGRHPRTDVDLRLAVRPLTRPNPSDDNRAKEPPVENSTLVRVLRTAVGALMLLRSRWRDLARARQAFAKPEAEPGLAIDERLNEALRELGAFDARTSWLDTTVTRLTKNWVAPDWFDKDHNRRWLSRPDVQRGIKEAARSKIAGQAPDVAA